VDTNNGVEAQNKALKYKFLPRKSVSLFNVASIIVDQFLPEQQRNYLFLNMQMDPTYRAYSTKVPAYLHGHPKKIIVHCPKKEEKARNTLSEKDIIEADQQNVNFVIKGKSGCIHKVNSGKESGMPSCTCQDWMRHTVPCKHFFLIFITQPQWSWNSLPSQCLQQPNRTCDTNALKTISEAISVNQQCL